MKRKLLLFGKNATLMDIFFTHMTEEFEILSCSPCTEDIMNHLKLFKPDAMIYCLNRETQEALNQVLNCRKKMEEQAIPFIIIGADADCDFVSQQALDLVALTITRPFIASAITENLEKFFGGRPGNDIEDISSEAGLQELDKLVLEASSMFLTPSDKHKRVLVVDDDARMLKLLKDYLREVCDVSTALNGRVAMKFLEKQTVDLILLDYEMPGENGPQILQKLHANEATKDIPVIFLTGIVDKSKIVQALSQKPQGYLLKPIDRNQLMETIGKFINQDED